MINGLLNLKIISLLKKFNIAYWYHCWSYSSC